MPHALVIDDNRTNLEVLTELLEMVGMSYTAVQDPTRVDEALQDLDAVDVVFLDLEMPKIDGYEMLGILKNEIGIEAPIVACTVHLSEINTARAMGFHSFLGKPLNPARFVDQLERILSDEPVWEAR